MKKTAIGLAAILAFASAPASAAEYVFGLTGPGQAGNGVLTTTDTPVDSRGYSAVNITGITGMINGLAITGLNGFLGSNNLYYLTGPSFFDGSGLGFTASDGSQSSLYFSVGNYRLTTFTGGFASPNVSVTSSPVASAVPEPTTWFMMILGMGAIGFAMRRQPNRKLEASFA